MNNLLKTCMAILCWSFPPSIVALVAGIALAQGVDHPWLRTLLLASLVLSCAVSLYTTGVCMALYENLNKKKAELDLANESHVSTNHKMRHLNEELEKLTGMREIQMSAHIESFADLLKNILRVTHIATDARALTIHLESRDMRTAFPKAHMRWEPADSQIPGDVFIFFNEEIALSPDGNGAIGNFSMTHVAQPAGDDNGELRGLISHEGRNVGEIVYTGQLAAGKTRDEGIRLLARWVAGFTLVTKAVYSCWHSRSSTLEREPHAAYIAVPILSQGLMMGVIAAEISGLRTPSTWEAELRKLQNTLLDYGRNIGQPLKKEELYEQAIKDGLTGLYNKTHYESQLNDHFHRMLRYEREFSFIFIDIDHFKKINDNYGHLTGDMALKSVAKIIMDNIRKSDLAFRIGGEELAVLLVETDLDHAVAVAEKLRSVIERTQFPTEDGRELRFTASFGVSCIHGDMKEPNELVSCADKAVYAAKGNGRNRVVSWTDEGLVDHAQIPVTATATPDGGPLADNPPESPVA